jgi:hypothetical protein
MNFKRPMIIILRILGLIVITLFVGKGLSSLQFSKKVATLFSHSEYSKQTFTFSQLKGLRMYYSIALQAGN